MDAAYLQKHVQNALSEALLAMAIHQPEDSVDFVGQYLIDYVARESAQKIEKEEMEAAEANAAVEATRVDKIERDKIDQLILAEKRTKRLGAFLESLVSITNKEALLDDVIEFLAEYIDVPAAYVAIKRTVEENDILYYTSSNSSQRAKVVGKKLAKVEYNEDEPVEREGISFDAFVVKDLPDEEEVDLEDENYVPPPPPKPEPLIVENTMREKRLKFLGIPMLGSFLAVPLSFQTLHHEEGCVVLEPDADEVAESVEETDAPAEASETAEAGEGEDVSTAPAVAVEAAVKRNQYGQNKRAQELLVCVDTVGRYRAITEQDVVVVSRIGEAMVARLEAIEADVFAQHTSFLAEAVSGLQTAIAAIAEEEAKALGLVEQELREMSEKKKEKPMAAEVPEADTVEGGEEVAAEKEEGAEEPEPEVEVEPEAEIEVEELPESLKPYKDAVALLRVWSSAFATGILQQPLLALGERYLLPATAPVKALLCLVAKMTGLDEAALAADVFGEQAWDPIRKNLIPALPAAIASYDPEAVVSVAAPMSLESLKISFEESGLGDASVYPKELPLLSMLSQWAQKAFEARAAAITYFSDVKGEQIETVV